MRFSAVILTSILATTVVSATPTTGRAQDRDAMTLPSGRLRIQVSPLFASFDRRFGYRSESGTLIQEEEPLGFDLTNARAGSRLLPILTPLERALRELSGDPALRLELGATRVNLEASRVVLPIQLEVGLFAGLQLGVNVPLVRRRVDAEFRLRRDSATVGLADAAAFNLFVGTFSSALSATRTNVDQRCQTSGEGSAECQTGRALVGRASSLVTALGETGRFLPLTGSREAQSLAATVLSIQNGMRQFGVQSFSMQAPFATAAVDTAAFQNVLTDPSFGFALDSLAFWQSGYELGDVELTAKLGFLQMPLTDSAGVVRSFAYRGAVGALLRLGTGTLDDPNRLVDLGTGDGQRDIEVSLYNDVLLGGRFMASVVARYGIQQPTTVERRISAPNQPIAPLSSLRPVEWTPGNYYAIDALPQVVINPTVSVGLPYSYFNKFPDTYKLAAGAGDSGAPSPDLLARETESTYHRLGVGIVYSAEVGAARLPFEARATFLSTIAGSGGRTVKESSVQVQIRTLLRLWGN